MLSSTALSVDSLYSKDLEDQRDDLATFLDDYADQAYQECLSEGKSHDDCEVDVDYLLFQLEQDQYQIVHDNCPADE